MENAELILLGELTDYDDIPVQTYTNVLTDRLYIRQGQEKIVFPEKFYEIRLHSPGEAFYLCIHQGFEVTLPCWNGITGGTVCFLSGSL